MFVNKNRLQDIYENLECESNILIKFQGFQSIQFLYIKQDKLDAKTLKCVDEEMQES